MRILYEDKNIVVCVKPVGVDSEHELPQLLGDEIYTLHRLDKNVGGVMVYGRTKSAAASFSKLIQDGQMVKEYVAKVHGTPPEQGDWQDLLFKYSRKNKVFVVKKQRAGVKPARLEFKRITAGEESLVQIRLHTGRSHQIRVQFSSRGFPLVGDHKYGSRSEIKEPMLHSCRISFPYRGETAVFEDYPAWYVTHSGTQTIETGRLVLRRATMNDSSAMFHNWAKDPQVTKYLTWSAHSTPEVTKAVLQDWVTSYERNDYYQWMIQLKDSNIGPIGSISVVSLDDKEGKAEIGYCIGRAWWHQGITTEALGAVIGYLFNQTGIQRIEARHDVNNPHSGAVMRKCGMQLMGIAEKADKNNQGICDCATYAIIK